jgi:hypothetical protein
MEAIPGDDYGCNSLDEQATVAQKFESSRQ